MQTNGGEERKTWKKQLLRTQSRTAGYDHQFSVTELQLPKQCSIHVFPLILTAKKVINDLLHELVVNYISEQTDNQRPNPFPVGGVILTNR